MYNTKYLIIGAGISGLTLARYLKDDYIVLEKENEVGGYCRTIRKGDFVWDYAGHFFHFKTEEFKKLFEQNINKNEVMYKDKCTKIWYNNQLIDYPFQTNIHQLEKQEFIDCLYDLFNKTEKQEYDNFLDMLYGKFGKSIVEKFLKPYNEKLYACDLETLDKDAMGRFFPYADIKQIIDNMKDSNETSYNNHFLYPRNGAGSFIDVLYQGLDKSRVKLDTSVVEVDCNRKIVLTSTGDEYKYDYLINTSPLNAFMQLQGKSQYIHLQSELSYNKVLVFNLGFNKKSDYKDEHWIYVPGRDYNYYRIGFYDNILDSDKLSMYIEIGYSKNAEIHVEEQLKETIKNLKREHIIDDTFILEEYSAIIMNPAYVHINGETEKKIREYKEFMEKQNVYTIGRYGGWTYCSMEDCMLEAKKLAEKIG